MSLRKALLMAAALLACVALLWRAEQSGRSGSPNTQVAALAPVSAETLEEVTVIHDRGKYGIRHDPKFGAWVMREPEGAPLNPEAARRILDAVLNIKAGNVLRPEEIEQDQGIYGLSPPEMLVTLKGVFGKRVISFGKKHSLTIRRYLQPEQDGSIYMVPEAVFAALYKTADEIRERNPVRFEPSAVSEFSILRPGQLPLVFKRAGAGEHAAWSVSEGPKTAAADPAMVGLQLARLARLSIKRFVDEPEMSLAFYGLVQPEFTLGLHVNPSAGSEPPRSLVVQIGRGVGVEAKEESELGVAFSASYYLKLAGESWVYELDRPFLGDFKQPLDFFRSRRPFSGLLTGDTRRIELQNTAAAAGSTLQLERDAASGLWSDKTGQTSRTFSGADVERLLDRIGNLEILSYLTPEQRVSLSGQTFNPPLLSLTLHAADSRTMRLLVGSPVDSAAGAKEQQRAGAASAPPRYARVQGDEGDELTAVLSGAAVEEILRDARIVPAGQ